MESQHRKITYRMKNRGMYWSQSGAEAMSRMIIKCAQHELRALFFGNWREEYQRIKSYPTVSEVLSENRKINLSEIPKTKILGSKLTAKKATLLNKSK